MDDYLIVYTFCFFCSVRTFFFEKTVIISNSSYWVAPLGSWKGTMDFSKENSTHDVVVSIKGSDASSYASTSKERIGIKTPNNTNISVNLIPPPTPPKVLNDSVRRRRPSPLSKSKSRLVEPPSPNDLSSVEEDTRDLASKSRLQSTPQRMSPVIILTSAPGQTEEDNPDVYKSLDLIVTRQNGKNLKPFVLVEWALLITLITLLILSLTIHWFQNTLLWSLALWKWCVLCVVVFCGRLVTQSFTHLIFCVMEQNCFLQRKFIYFVHGLKGSVWVFVWLGFIFLSWVLLFSHGVHRAKKNSKILDHITLALGGFFIGAAMWLLKSLVIRTIALSFHMERFFDRIQESLFHQYVLQILSGPSWNEVQETGANSGQLSFKDMGNGKEVKEEVIDVKKLHRINRNLVSESTMKGLISVIKRTKLSTMISGFEDGEEDEGENNNQDITSEQEAKVAAQNIFKKLAMTGQNYIEEKDLLPFMNLDEVDRVFPSFEGAFETGKITKSALEKWVVNAYMERKWLAYSLTDTGTAIKGLNNIFSTLVLLAIVIVWNLMMGFFGIKFLVFLTSQLLLLVFMFGNTAKIMFEAVIFVFVMHPFDVGDRCVIDGVEMIVEEMKILTTIFLRYDNEKICYPNSVLASKPISNFYRSPEMSDSIQFAIDFSTKVETIAALRERIKLYIESKPQQWRASHSVQVKDILERNKITMGLSVTHTINFQESGLKSTRKSDLILELKKILEELGIKYSLPPLYLPLCDQFSTLRYINDFSN